MKRIKLAGLLATLGGCATMANALAQEPKVPVMPAAVTGKGFLSALPAKGDVEALSLKDFIQLIARSDEMVLVQRLEESIAAEGVKGANAIFEPSFFMSAERENTFVLNTASEYLQRGTQAEYKSRVDQYKTGVAMKAATGADVELSYNVSRIENSLQAQVFGLEAPEYRSYLGAKITQPLLRGAGSDATTTGIQVAERDKGVARETVRQVLAQRVMDGIVAYLNVQRAQTRVNLRTQARDIAEKLLLEIRKQEAVGLKSASELLDAESAASMRRSQLAQAQQDLEEQLNSFQALISARERRNQQLTARRYVAADNLTLLELPAGTAASQSPGQGDGKTDFTTESVARRPEIRVNQIRMEREDIRVRYAQNQMLPELNFTMRYGLEDLTAPRYRGLDNYFTRSDYPYNSWMVGLQFKYYLFGDEKRSSEYATARLRQQQVVLAQAALEQRIANELESSAAVLDKSRQQALRQREVVNAQRESLRIEEKLVQEGRKSSIDLMKKQLDALVAEESLADSIVLANRAGFIVSQAQGLILSRVGLE